MYTAVTRSIEVSVTPLYLEEESDPNLPRYLWAYTVEITNLGDSPVQLLNRYWHITDGLGRIEEVRGAGVIGEQPVIDPGSTYEYTSGCPLPTPSGIMVGAYEMESPDGQRFLVDVPAFSLDLPDTPRTVN
ncbi:Co2+/Mg2+ efflux protein ApaG [Coralliovum pocilloporae]|uniref:Co2+/Mg2+ efflux protein ApaG n=1 Tax=Coralliovum pocilloporae TaxID=3066369 RepID=UPI003307ADF7